MADMQIIDNFLPNNHWAAIQSELESDTFSWHLNKATSYDEDNYYQMIHNIYKDDSIKSKTFWLLEGMIYRFQDLTGHEVKRLNRIKCNLLFNRPITEEQKEKVIHQDVELDNYISMLYYVSDSDGDTVIFEDDKKTEKMRVQPKANRALIFDSKLWHTGNLPEHHQIRVVINFIFEIK